MGETCAGSTPPPHKKNLRRGADTKLQGSVRKPHSKLLVRLAKRNCEMETQPVFFPLCGATSLCGQGESAMCGVGRPSLVRAGRVHAPDFRTRVPNPDVSSLIRDRH